MVLEIPVKCKFKVFRIGDKRREHTRNPGKPAVPYLALGMRMNMRGGHSVRIKQALDIEHIRRNGKIPHWIFPDNPVLGVVVWRGQAEASGGAGGEEEWDDDCLYIHVMQPLISRRQTGYMAAGLEHAMRKPNMQLRRFGSRFRR